MNGKIESKYILPSSFKVNDNLIRMDIARQFFDYLESMKYDTRVAFFNMNFDVSQFLYYMVNQSTYTVKHHNEQNRFTVKKGELLILESDRQLYSISLRTKTHGKLIWMIDIANFLPGSTLDSACKGWIGEGKVELESKHFYKTMPTEIEQQYAMKDAEITYKLFRELMDVGVIEGQRYVTIAGRTIGHFKNYLFDNYNSTFNDYFFYTDDKDEVDIIKNRFEKIMRPSTRGGMCMAVHTGVYEHCTHIDARSMYPTQGHKPYIPMGDILTEKPKGKSTGFFFPRGYFRLKDGKLPYFQWRTKAQCYRYQLDKEFKPGEYVTECFLDGSYGIWSDEWEIIKKNYMIDDYDVFRQYYFRMEPNEALYHYYEEVYNGKMNNTGSKKLYYKYLLNSLYGKFLSRPDGVAIDYIDGRRVKVEETDRSTYYLPLGMWIAMGGRVDLFKAMSSIPYEDVLYCDTDSIIYTGNKMPNVTLGKYMGEWSLEAEDVSAYIVGPKTYQELSSDGSLITKCAGMPRAVKDKQDWLGIYEGYTVRCQKPRRDPVTWAINFEDIDYTISTRAGLFSRGAI